MKPDEMISLVEHVPSYGSGVEQGLSSIELLQPSRPAVFTSMGGGEFGDHAATAARAELVVHFAEKQILCREC